jgi:ankyrin repeat protein
VSRNSLTNTPLHAAAAGKHSDIALLLLAHGAKSNTDDAGGYTPLEIATQNQLGAVVEKMASLNSSDADHRSAETSAFQFDVAQNFRSAAGQA